MCREIESPLTFVVAANDRGVLNSNLLSSPCFSGTHDHQVLVLEGHSSAATAYNIGLDRALNETVVFAHQDVFLPDTWLPSMYAGLSLLKDIDPNWGVAGCCGITAAGNRLGHLYTPGEGVVGKLLSGPQRVRVLDELVLVLRKSSGIRFSDDLPGFHFYGPDICLAAEQQQMNCYVITAFCIHNARQYFDYPTDFYSSYRIMKRKWAESLPVQTSCIRISKFDSDVWKRRVRRAWCFLSGLPLDRGLRVEDPRQLWRQIQIEGQV